MALTSEEKREKDEAKLEAMLADLTAAKVEKETGKVNAILDKLLEFKMATEFIDLQNIADKIVAAANIGQVSNAIDRLTEIAEELSGHGNTIKKARKMAATGKKELLLPRLAANAAQGLEVFKAMQDVVEKLEAAGNAGDLGEVKTAVDEVLAALNTVKEKAEAIST
jgi:hypothetical protein